MSRYYRYHLKLTDRGHQIEVWASDPNGEPINEPGGSCSLSDSLERISSLAEKVRRGSARKAEREKLGEALFEALFPPDVTSHFRSLLHQVAQEEAILRLELDLDEDDLPEIAAFPWEFLRAPQTGRRAVDDLGTHPQLVLSRRRDLWEVAPAIALKEPLRIQLIVSAPGDLGSVEYKDVVAALEELANAHPEQIAPPLEILHNPTPQSLEAVLEQRKPHILHFIGHGKLEKVRRIEYGQLAFVGNDGQADWRKDEEISTFFQVYSPKVVLLQACESGKEGSAGAFVGVASQIVQRNVPVVVAMQYPVSNDVASRFAKEFYQRVGELKPVDVAVQRSRRALQLTFPYTRDFGAPVLFMRVKDGQLFVPPAPQNAESVQSEKEGASEKGLSVFSFPQSCVYDFPHPIAVACAEYNAVQTTNERFKALDCLLNNLIKYLTAIALSLYWQDQPDRKQLRTWLGALSHAHLKTSLHIFRQISEYYQAKGEKPYLFPLLFEPCTAAIEAESPIADACYVLKALQHKRQAQSEDITLGMFLEQLLTLRQTKWESDVNRVEAAIQEQLLPVLGPALRQLSDFFQPLLRYPLRYIERVDPDSQEWVYTTVEFPGPKGEPVVTDQPFRENGGENPRFQTRRLYLCSSEGQPRLNLHPFLIAHLYKLYFLEQATDRADVWYQHCASANRYNPPPRYSSFFPGATQVDEVVEETEDPVSQLEKASTALEEDEQEKRFSEMPLSVVLAHLSDEGRQALEIAMGESLRIGQFWLGVEFLLMGLSKQEGHVFPKFLKELQIDPGDFRGVLRGTVDVINDNWRQITDVAAPGAEALSRVHAADPEQLRHAFQADEKPQPVLTPRMFAVLQDAVKIADEGQVGHNQLLAAALRHPQSLALQLFFSIVDEAGWSSEQVFAHLSELLEIQPDDLFEDTSKPDNEVKPPPDLFPPSRKSPRGKDILTDFGRDLTEEAHKGKIHQAQGEPARKAMTQLGRILLQREANNPILIGDPGVGKTALVEGFAWRLAGYGKGAVKALQGRRVIELSANTLTAGTKYRGDLEERLQQLLKEVKKAEGQIIVFIDEIHSILGGGASGGLSSIADAIKPALARGEFPCIGATTVAEYRQHIEKDAALARRFTPVWIEEPTLEEAIRIVQLVVESHLAEHHQVTVEPQAVEAAVTLSARYLHDEHLPGKAIKVLDQACSGLIVGGSLSGEPEDEYRSIQRKVVTREAVLEVIADRTNIPVKQLAKSDKERLLELEGTLKKRIIGQEEAITQVAKVVKRAGAGLSDPRRPLGVFLFAGPTGVGKTELALALTEALFDNEDAIFRLDMSEFMEKHQVSRLIGAPPGYVGYEQEGQLTGHLRRRPYSVVLLDEMEKAHEDVQHLFLQLFDTGRLTDSQGRLADGRNAIFIMTTNLGAKEALGFANTAKSYQEKLKAAIDEHFSMEFRNRLDRIIYFTPLDENALFAIFDREFAPFQARLKAERGIEVIITDNIKRQIVRQVAVQQFGARPLRRLIEDQIVASVVDKLLSGEYQPGAKITISQEFQLPDEQPKPTFDPDKLPFDPANMPPAGFGQPKPPVPKPKRPTTPEEGLPHKENVDAELQRIFDEHFLALARRLHAQGIALEVDSLAKFFLCKPDESLHEGRSIEQTFQQLIEDPIADKLLHDEFQNGDWIRIDYKSQKIVLEKMEE